MSFLRLSKFALAASCAAILASFVLVVTPGPHFSIEFTGGTLMEVRLPVGKTKDQLTTAMHAYEKQASSLGNFVVSSISDQSGQSFLLRMRPLSNEEHVALLAALQKDFTEVKELKYTTIGPSLSSSLKKNSFLALGLASLAVIAYLAFAFRKMPRKLSPWKFGVLTIVGFLHDVIITIGIFIIIGRFTSFEVDPLFVTALLTILAYSANDTIVIFDRIRDNVSREGRGEDFGTTVTQALRQTVTRTINIVIPSLVMLFCLYFLGSETIHWFILALIVGTLIGAYSSYFVAAPLLIFWRKRN